MANNSTTTGYDSEDRFHEAIASFEEARDAGNNPDPNEWIARHPDLADRLSGYFADQRRMQNLVAPTVPAHLDGEQVPEIDDYRVLEQIGPGGMGIVYKALRISTNQIVALKVIRPDRLLGLPAEQRRKTIERFITEAQAAAQLEHDNIVKVYEVGEQAGRPFYSMRYVDGSSLHELIQAGPLDGKVAAAYMEQVARAIHEAHRYGILHRDISPHNVMVDAKTDRALVTDFGLAKLLQAEPGAATGSMTESGAVMGKPPYMSPEQAQNSAGVTVASDVYSLGATLYALLTGRPPFRADTPAAILKKVIEEDPTSPRMLQPLIPRDLETIALKCLEKEPEQRYASAAELADDMRRYLSGEPIEARAVGRLEKAAKWARRNPVVSSLATTAVLLLVSGSTGTYLKFRDAKANEKKAQEKEQLANNRATELNEQKKEVIYQLALSDLLLSQSNFNNHDSELARDRLARVPPELRNWEWYYLQRRFSGGIFALRGHTRAVRAAKFSADGSRIVTVSADGTARVWNARTGSSVLTLMQQSVEVNSVAFSPDGSKIVTGNGFAYYGTVGDRSGAVCLWDARTGRRIRELKAHYGAKVWAIEFSPDGSRIVSGSLDGTACVWDAHTGGLCFRLKRQSSEVRSVAFSPDGSRIAAAIADGTVRIWDVRTGSDILAFKAHRDVAESVAFSADGSRIVTGGWDKTARIWDARTGSRLLELNGHSDRVTSVAFSPDTLHVVTGSLDKTGRVWNTHTGSLVLELKGHSDRVTSVAFSPDSSRIVTGSFDNTAQVWDAWTGSPVLELRGHKEGVTSVDIDASGSHVVTGSSDWTARVWDSQNGSSIRELKGHAAPVLSVAFSRDGSRIVTGSADYTARIWDAHSGKYVLELPAGHTGWITSVEFSPDGLRVLTGSRDTTVRVWDANAGNTVLELNGHTKDVRCTRYSRDGLRILSGSDDTTARVWDAYTGSPVLELRGHTASVLSAVFSPDGLRIGTASADRTARVWDAQTGSRVFELKGHTDSVTSIAFSPDGTRIVTGSADKSVKVWDARTGTPVVQLNGHLDGVFGVSCVAFSSDGSRIVSGGHDKTAQVWDARIGKELVGTDSSDPKWNADEVSARLFHTRPQVERHRESLDQAREFGEVFAACFHIERMLAYAASERPKLLAERNRLRRDPLLETRAALHTPTLQVVPASWEIVAILSARGDRLGLRLWAQKLISDGKPGDALPALHVCLLGRRNRQPPVEELLIADALLKLNNTDDARRYYQAAVEWLDRPRHPMRAAGVVSHGFGGIWTVLGEMYKPIDDPRYNSLDWESWHEADMFRAALEPHFVTAAK
jgi:WD40 repeat protein/predicted Ser/Thr protein kinase